MIASPLPEAEASWATSVVAWFPVAVAGPVRMSGGPAPEIAPMTRFERGGTVARASTGVDVTSAVSGLGDPVPDGAAPSGAVEPEGPDPRCEPESGTFGVVPPELVGNGVSVPPRAMWLPGTGSSGASPVDPSSVTPLLPVRAMATPRLVTLADWSMIDAPCLVVLVVADCMTLVVATFPLATAGPV